MKRRNFETLEAVTHKHFTEKEQLNSSNYALLELGEFLLTYKKINRIEKMEMLYI